MDSKYFEPIDNRDIDNMEDGSEIFWEKASYIFEDQTTETIKNGKLKKTKKSVFKGIKYEAFRTKLSKYHHRSISGMEACLIMDPNGEYPYIPSWQSEWIYACSDSIGTMWRRKSEPDNNI